MIDVETKELRIAVCNNSRNAEVMLPWINQWVEKGTIIRTDCWAAYNKLEEMGYKHETVNHSKEFVTTEGVHTNLIESSWRPLKTFFETSNSLLCAAPAKRSSPTPKIKRKKQ